jgi:glutathione S-transferase
MPTLYHHPLCPRSRFVRMVMAELGLEADLVEERTWERRRGFLELDPAGETPVLVEEGDFVVPGARTIAEFLDEVYGPEAAERRLLPRDIAGRVEVRRLGAWFLDKFNAEVSEPLVTEKIYKRFIPEDQGGGAPDMAVIRAARHNIRYHLHYVGYLIGSRNWLAGETLTLADCAAAAALSSVDYLGDVPWDENTTARAWYQRVKSRPSLRPILADRVPGMAPASHYEDLDF